MGLFDSGAPFVDVSDNGGSTTWTADIHPTVVSDVTSLPGYPLGVFEVTPSAGIRFGRGSQWGSGMSARQRYSAAAWTVELDDYHLEASKTYYYAVDRMVMFIWMNALGSQGVYVVRQVIIRQTDEQGNVKWESVIFDTPMDQASLVPTVSANARHDVLNMEDTMQEISASPGDKVTLEVRYMTTPNSITNWTVTGRGAWFAFVGAGLYEIKELDPWEEEQRGFWANVISWLQRIYDGILSIPEAIANLPQLILDGLRSLFIPEEGAIEELVDDFREHAEGRLGFVAQLVSLVPAIIGPLVNSGEGDVILQFPAIQLPSAFGGRELVGVTPFNLTAVVDSSTAMRAIYTVYRVLASVMIFGLLLRYLYKVSEEILGQRGDK